MIPKNFQWATWYIWTYKVSRLIINPKKLKGRLKFGTNKSLGTRLRILKQKVTSYRDLTTSISPQQKWTYAFRPSKINLNQPL